MFAEEFPRSEAQDIASNEQEFDCKQATGFSECAIKMLAIETWHFHITNDQRVVAIERGDHSATRIMQHVGRVAEIAKHVRDQLRDRWLVFNHQHPAHL